MRCSLPCKISTLREAQGGSVRWIKTPDEPNVLHFVRSNGWHCLINFSTQPVAMPDGIPLLSSEPTTEPGPVPPDTTVWSHER